jgi:hypothetical protein
VMIGIIDVLWFEIVYFGCCVLLDALVFWILAILDAERDSTCMLMLSPLKFTDSVVFV